MDNDLMARRLRPPSEPALPPPPPTYHEQWAPENYEETPALEMPHAFEQPQPAQAQPQQPQAQQWDPQQPQAQQWDPPQPPAEQPQLFAQNDFPPQAQIPATPTYWTPPSAEPMPANGYEPHQPQNFEHQPPAFEQPPAFQPAPTYQAPTFPQVSPFQSGPTFEQTQPQPMAAWPAVQREAAPWDRPAEVASPTDMTAPDQPAWDQPSMDDWMEPEPFDDRSPEMLEGYTETVAVAAQHATPAESIAADPDDAYAPVLGDLSDASARPWPGANGHDSARNGATVAAVSSAEPYAPGPETIAAPPPEPTTYRAPIAPISAIAPTGIADRGIGPTPPTGLFGNGTYVTAQAQVPAAAEPQPDEAPEEFADQAVVEPVLEAAPEAPAAARSAPELLTTPEPAPPAPTRRQEMLTIPAPWAMPAAAAPSPPAPVAPAPQPPMVVRIELAIVDDSKRVVPAAEAARRVNPEPVGVPQTVDADAEAAEDPELLMPRHPDFEPRAARASDAVEVPPAAPAPAPIVSEPQPFMADHPAFPSAAAPWPAPSQPWPQSHAESAWVEPLAQEPAPPPPPPFAPPVPAASGPMPPTPTMDYQAALVSPLTAGPPTAVPPWAPVPAQPFAAAPEPFAAAPEPFAAQPMPQPAFEPQPVLQAPPPLQPTYQPQAPVAPPTWGPPTAQAPAYTAAPEPLPFNDVAPPPWAHGPVDMDPLARLPAAGAPETRPMAAPVQAAPEVPHASPRYTAEAYPGQSPYAQVAPPVQPPTPTPQQQLPPTAYVHPQPDMQPAYAAPQYSQYAPAAVAPYAAPAPAQQPMTAPHAAAPAGDATRAAVTSAAAVPQSDLWFLATEPATTADTDQDAAASEAATDGEPSSLLMAVATIGMAVVVIGLVLVFLWLMTSVFG